MTKDFDTEDELLFALQLEELGIEYDKQVSFTIDEGFTRTNGKKYRDSVYTPDFVFKTKIRDALHEFVPSEVELWGDEEPYEDYIKIFVRDGIRYMLTNNCNKCSLHKDDNAHQTAYKTYVIEIKGWSMFDDPFKYRIAEKKFLELGYEFHKLKLSGSTADATTGFYDYSSGMGKKKTKNNSEKNKRSSKQFFYKEGVISHDTPLEALRRAKKHTYESVYKEASEFWYEDHSDDSEISDEFVEEYVMDNFYIFGQGKDYIKVSKNKDGEEVVTYPWKYIRK